MKRLLEFLDPDFLAIILIILLILFVFLPHAHAKDVRTVKLNQTTVAVVRVSPGRSTVLSFPTKPTKVILGNQGIFGLEYVENDLAIAALSPHSHSDLFVYLEGRRFAFDLVAVPSGGDTIVLVRDAPEIKEEVAPASRLQIHPRKPQVKHHD